LTFPKKVYNLLSLKQKKHEKQSLSMFLKTRFGRVRRL